MRIFITKRALTRGIECIESKGRPIDGYVHGNAAGKNKVYQFATYCPGEWYKTYEEALKRASQLKRCKIKCLLKQLSKIELLQFNDPTKENTK